MGSICPCQRDPKPQEQNLLPLPRPATSSLTLMLSEESSQDEFSPDISLKAEERITELAHAVTSRFNVIEEQVVKEGYSILKATISGSEQPCTIKVVPKDVITFRRRSEIFNCLMKLDHPNIQKTYEVCQDQKSLYFVTEAAEKNLLDLLHSRGRLREAEAQRIVRQLLGALNYCHRRGFVHKSISLRAITVHEAKNPPILNIKVAGIEDWDLRAIKAKEVVDFMAPEARKAFPGAKSDIWSCGVVLYHLLSGRSPFENTRKSSFSFPPALWEGYSQQSQDLIVQMLAKRPERRPTASECLQHPWLRTQDACAVLSTRNARASILRLREKQVDSPLRKAILLFMIHRVVAPEEITKLAQTFTALDSDNSGEISKEELVQALQKTAQSQEVDCEATRIMGRVDFNFSGKIDFSEFLLATFSADVLLSQENLKKAFRTLDRDGTGQISWQELNHHFRVNNTSGSADKWKSLIAEFDQSGDGEIDFLEFESVMKRVV